MSSLIKLCVNCRNEALYYVVPNYPTRKQTAWSMCQSCKNDQVQPDTMYESMYSVTSIYAE